MGPRQSTPGSPRVAAVTVSYGSERVLPPFLASVPASSSSPISVVIADNRPESGTVAQIAASAGAQYLAMPRNLGYGSAMNAGVAVLPATVEWVLLSNPDVVLAPGALDRLVAAGEADSRIGSVGPAILNSDGSVYPSARAVPSLRTGIGHAMFANLWPSNPWSQRYRNDSTVPGRGRDAGWLSGACLLVRRSAFDDVGGFDESFFMYFEDVDLGYRLGKKGYRNVYEPAARAAHAGAHATTTDSVKMIAAHHESARKFLAKKYSGVALWPLRAMLTVGLNIRSALAARRVTQQGH
ncbi:N-acetylglucosaminyl-diphospho-decaprenol L-rhamnosyltransferase [Cryobacterium mesophilum]|uniref:Glycosyltransferase family 2 protein n=1 Tax=Terrimesophilobacter mesophilus TaxID=433647 RepID=A0A4R8VBR7_9MICO|nr:glycosyltransferase family 2 protein [Terrimesophilobacter mesophilus]MBB5632674.1 N-acetylglucosaminyl-diphospho-decaprenol L-rhamnosyltransferase [Terrimesophilobacter mesophilus]TFB79482.1 glycosyltransferase family 2 protein [Terrimesophilobacter mesophilus]